MERKQKFRPFPKNYSSPGKMICCKRDDTDGRQPKEKPLATVAIFVACLSERAAICQVCSPLQLTLVVGQVPGLLSSMAPAESSPSTLWTVHCSHL